MGFSSDLTASLLPICDVMGQNQSHVAKHRMA